MATIIIRDLPESVDLDRQAMLAIMGGARFRSRAADVARPAFRGKRLVGYPSGRTGKAEPETAPGAPIR
jgi:hypothetical protein